MSKKSDRTRIREEKEARKYMIAIIAISGVMLLLFMIYFLMGK